MDLVKALNYNAERNGAIENYSQRETKGETHSHMYLSIDSISKPSRKIDDKPYSQEQRIVRTAGNNFAQFPHY